MEFGNFKKLNCSKTKFSKIKAFHCHLVPRLTRNETSSHEEHFPCGTSSDQYGFVNEKRFQRDRRYKKSRGSWERFYPCASIRNRAVNSQPSFRREYSQSASSSSTPLMFPFCQKNEFLYSVILFLIILLFSKITKQAGPYGSGDDIVSSIF